MAKPLRLVRQAHTVPDAERGKLLEPAEVAAVVFNAKVSAKWVLANVPREYRHKVGRLVLYYEGEVRQWTETLRDVA